MKEHFDRIDEKLGVLLEEMEYIDYLHFIYSNEKVRVYDFITGRLELGVCPTSWLELLTESRLEQIEEEIDEKLREILICN